MIMKKPSVHLTTRVTVDKNKPFIESRVFPFGEAGGPIPKGKILVIRMPILPPGASDEEIKAQMEQRLIDDDGSGPLFCPDCEAETGNGYEWLEETMPWVPPGKLH
jgi:hypothetical protein